MDPESFRESFRPQAERAVKVRLALEKVAELENIVPTQEELDAEYEKTVSYTHLDVYKRQVFDCDLLKIIKPWKPL